MGPQDGFSDTVKLLRFNHLNVTPCSNKSSGLLMPSPWVHVFHFFFPPMSRLRSKNLISDVSAGKVYGGVCAALLSSPCRWARLQTSSSHPRASSPDKPSLRCRCGADTALTSWPPSAPTKRETSWSVSVKASDQVGSMLPDRLLSGVGRLFSSQCTSCISRNELPSCTVWWYLACWDLSKQVETPLQEEGQGRVNTEETCNTPDL